MDDKFHRGASQNEILEEIGYLHSYPIETHKAMIEQEDNFALFMFLSYGMAKNRKNMMYLIVTHEKTTNFSGFPRILPADSLLYWEKEWEQNRKDELEEPSDMQLPDLQSAVTDAILNYDSSYLRDIDSRALYDDQYKDEFITDIERNIKSLKAIFPEGLYVKESRCFFCFPGEKTFDFHSNISDEQAISYIILEDNEKGIEEVQNNEIQYMVRECRNYPISDDVFEEET